MSDNASIKDNNKKDKPVKKNRRSMQKRIRKYMVLNSSISSLILSIVVIIGVMGAINSFGAMASNVIASDIAGELENPMSLSKFGVDSLEEIDTTDEMFQRWLFSIGNKFYFNLGSGFIMHAEEDVMNAPEFAHGQLKANLKNGPGEFQLVFVKIYLNDMLCFSTVDESEFMKNFNLDSTDTTIYHTSEVAFRNRSGDDIGKVVVTFNPVIIISIAAALIMIFIIATLLSSFISMLMTKIMAKSLTKPLSELQRRMDMLTVGDIENALRSEVELKKPFVEVENLALSTNAIIEKMREYAESLEDHKVELTAQNEELGYKSEHLIRINGQLEEINVQMKDILDNVGQGFLRFQDDLLIHSGYSLECTEMFGCCIANKKFSGIVFPNDEEQSGFVDELLKKIMDKETENYKIYLPLLPDEVILDEKIIKIDYRLSMQKSGKRAMIVILTDITEKRSMEEQMDKEQNILKMVVKALVNRSMFVEIADSFIAFIADGKENDWKFIPDKYENDKYIMRQLHNFKGNFSQFDVIELTGALHDAESQMLEIVDKKIECDNSPCFDLEMVMAAYEHDLGIIQNYVGEDFMLKDEYFLVEKTRILNIERKMQEVLSEQDCRVLLPEIRSLCYRSVKDLLKMYPEYTLKMAERLDKSIYQFDIESDNVSVDELRYQDFTKSLVHVFRNAIDHGIESQEERAEIGKEIMGSITCDVKGYDGYFELIIKDDGRGIDKEKVRTKLIDRGFNSDVIMEYDDNQLFDHLFDDDFSTTDVTTLLSGRGVGLASVKKEVELLQGEVKVISEMGKGTEFIFKIPLNVDIKSKDILPINLMETLAKTSSEYLSTYVGETDCKLDTTIRKGNKIELDQITALVSLKGIINGLIMLSVNRPMAKKLARSFLIDVNEDDVEMYIEDVLAEIANTVIGNTLGKLDDSSDFLHMGIPAIISNKGAYVKYTNTDMITFNLMDGDCIWSVHMIQLENTEIEEESLWQI